MRVLKKELWPERVELDIDDTQPEIDEVKLWLAENFGAFKTGWNAIYGMKHTDFYFRRSQDAVLFALRWQ
jgi:hypothetical protein